MCICLPGHPVASPQSSNLMSNLRPVWGARFKGMKLLAKDQPRGAHSSAQAAHRTQTRRGAGCTFVVLVRHWAPASPPTSSALGFPRSAPGGNVPSRGTPKKPLASSLAAGLGDVMCLSQTLHKPLELALQSYLPGQSAATTEVSVWRLSSQVTVKNAHVNPTSTDNPSHRGWNL